MTELAIPDERISKRHIPENFRGSEFGFYPERIVKETKRVRTLRSAIKTATEELVDPKKVGTRLFDLAVYNAHYRVFPNPNSAADFVGVVDSGENPQLENAIVLVTIVDRRSGKTFLAVPGGFNDIGEAITQTADREAREETGAQNISNFMIFGEQSKKMRDNRFSVISTCCAGLIRPNEMQAGDDAGSFVIVPLEKSRKLNMDYMTPGVTHTDLLGRSFSHDGIRADHDEILANLYHTWKRKGSEAPLAQFVKNESSRFPQEWFKSDSVHAAGADVYQFMDIETGEVTPKPSTTPNLMLTPNSAFALARATEIFAQAGLSLEESQKRARTFIHTLVTRDGLPYFPQAATTIDCVIASGDDLIVHQMRNGMLALPGSYVSFDPADHIASLEHTAHQIIAKKYGADFRPKIYLGAVGGSVATGTTDTRYPRLPHVFAGRITGAYEARTNGGLPKDALIVRIPIWKDKQAGILSDEITQGTWMYGHNQELLPLFTNWLIQSDPKRQFTAENLLMSEKQ